MDKKNMLLTAVASSVLTGTIVYFWSRNESRSDDTAVGAQSEVERVALEFLHAQTERDLDKMCRLVADDIIYINEPHPPDRAIKGKAKFREGWFVVNDQKKKTSSIITHTRISFLK